MFVSEITRDSGSNSSTSLDVYDAKPTIALHHAANTVTMPPNNSPSAMPDTYAYGAATTPTSNVVIPGGWTAPVPVATQQIHPRNGFVDVNYQEGQNNYTVSDATQRRPDSAKSDRRPTSAKQERRPWSASSGDATTNRRAEKVTDPEIIQRKPAGKTRVRTLNHGKNGVGDYANPGDAYIGYPTQGQGDGVYSGLEDNNEYTSRKIRDDIPDSDLIDYEDDGGDSLIDSVDLDYDDTMVRIFIALFDYDPSIMSPNPDAIDEELPFKEGQLIKASTDKCVTFILQPKHLCGGNYCGCGVIIAASFVAFFENQNPCFEILGNYCNCVVTFAATFIPFFVNQNAYMFEILNCWGRFPYKMYYCVAQMSNTIQCIIVFFDCFD